MIREFIKFMEDEEYWDMTITGPAGSGKTTGLRQLIEHCIEHEIPYIVCAYTHTACGILRSKLPANANVATLHSFLKKRPMLNQQATNKKNIQLNKQMSLPDRPIVMFCDEYSMVGEKDGIDIRAEQDPDYEGKPALKVVYIGDNNQLPPVGDMAFEPDPSPYDVKLTTIYRQSGDNELLTPLSQLVDMINGAKPVPLLPNKNFVRGVNIAEHLKDFIEEAISNLADLDYVCLAYTNKRVEELNKEIQGYHEPLEYDRVFSPTTKKFYKFIGWVDKPAYIDTPFNGELHLNSKYQTLEYLIKSGMCRFAELEAEEGYALTVAVVFGHYQYKLKDDELKNAAAQSNSVIEKQFRGFKAAAWAKNNSTHKLARQRAKAWRDLLSFNDCVICIDFTHAMTVHKSQGMTYNTVYLDSDDLHLASKSGMQMYLKLMYVAMSRASGMVYTN